MRTLLWLLWLAFAVECVALTMLASFVMMSLDSQRAAPPGFTGMFFTSPKAWLLLPIPWLVAAALLSRRSPSPTTLVFVFIGTLAVAAAFVLGVMVIGGILPTLTFR